MKAHELAELFPLIEDLKLILNKKYCELERRLSEEKKAEKDNNQ